ncbi:hypothetical protein [Legionella waltersii]|uniref:Uncharacterized protein n=1 Tax=Legionella waltersii TaxID=66969 RepID=A0A0W1ANQ5_9GAMM|nr:hypothetical protein [Legionella waltersii]KTD82941.1 hypothetical protein Lwal_0419 [Legionella waltersii]SNV02446.1 Uncharacterised protein [Legionella waltersii]
MKEPNNGNEQSDSTKETPESVKALHYQDLLTLKQKILSEARLNVGVLPRLARLIEAFVQKLLLIENEELEHECIDVFDWGRSLSPFQIQSFKKIIEAEFLNTNDKRLQKFWFTPEEALTYYRNSYESLTKSFYTEVEDNFNRALVLYLILEYEKVPEVVQAIDIGKTEPSIHKVKRASDAIEQTLKVKISKYQFVNDAQVLGYCLQTFYGIVRECQKHLSSFPQEFNERFREMVAQVESNFIPEKAAIRDVAATKMVSSYSGDKVPHTHDDYKPLCRNISEVLAVVPIEKCMEFVKKSEANPEECFSAGVTIKINSLIDAAYQQYVSNLTPKVENNLTSKQTNSQQSQVAVEKETSGLDKKTKLKKAISVFSFFNHQNTDNLVISEPICISDSRIKSDTSSKNASFFPSEPKKRMSESQLQNTQAISPTNNLSKTKSQMEFAKKQLMVENVLNNLAHRNTHG